MKVEIAGYNIDANLISELDKKASATPETISAAYARISRSKNSVTELRKSALEEIEKSRRSNQVIVYEMGHSSIAEHAVYNIDIIGVSRYLTEFIQRSRLASFTEKSQRYVTLKKDYVVPKEIKNTFLEGNFHTLITRQNDLYQKMYEKAEEYLLRNNFPDTKRELEGKAKEDARYILSLATKTQMGMTINARSLTRLLRRLDSVSLNEAQELKNKIETQVKKITPSLIRYTSANKYEKEILHNVPQKEFTHNRIELELLEYSPDPEDIILAGIFFEKNGGNFQEIKKYINSLDITQKERIFQDILLNIAAYNSLPRAFELVNFTFSLIMSASCFAQFKRHRISTILRSEYDPNSGFILPPLIEKIEMKQEFLSVYNETIDLYQKLDKLHSQVGNYILPNAQKMNIIFKANLRELFHLSRLRSDVHAQWEIRAISKNIDQKLKSLLPLAGKYLGGKSEIN